jgi:hypothetical protein
LVSSIIIHAFFSFDTSTFNHICLCDVSSMQNPLDQITVIFVSSIYKNSFLDCFHQCSLVDVHFICWVKNHPSKANLHMIPHHSSIDLKSSHDVTFIHQNLLHLVGLGYSIWITVIDIHHI